MCGVAEIPTRFVWLCCGCGSWARAGGIEAHKAKTSALASVCWDVPRDALRLILFVLLNLGHAAVDAKFGTGDEAALVGRQKQRRCGDLLGLAHAAERNLGGQ